MLYGLTQPWTSVVPFSVTDNSTATVQDAWSNIFSLSDQQTACLRIGAHPAPDSTMSCATMSCVLTVVRYKINFNSERKLFQ